MLKRILDFLLHPGLWYAVLGVAIIIFILHISGPSKYEQEKTAWNAEKQQILSTNEKLQHENDSLAVITQNAEKTAQTQTQRIDKLKETASKLRTRNDSLLEIAKKLPDTCSAAVKAAEGFKEEADSLRITVQASEKRDSARKVEVQSLERRLVNTEQQRDSLQKLVLTVPEPKKERLLWIIPLPSRKASYIVGIATGVVGSIIVVRAIK